jgi:opacity protein-like surface antigen
MRTVQSVILAATLTAVLPAISAAQSQSPSPTPPPTPPPAPAPPAPASPLIAHQANTSYWTASGFVGSNFGAGADNASVDFGGQLAYLYRGMIGAEFLADFAPHFRINNALLADNPNVNSYMVNAIAAVPIGSEARVQPYVSGGLGGIQLRSDMLNFGAGAVVGTTTAANQTRFGGNIGAGVMAFAGNVGIRGDVRYYRAFNNDISTNATTAADVFAQNLLSGLDFWRANIGIAVRW